MFLMLLPRVIPCLLLKGVGLVKGEKFKNHTYVGDPINAVHIFNEKDVDEMLFLDITATKENRTPPLDLIQKIADQCLMPFGVGGGIKTIQHVKDILSRGAEKVCLNTAAVENPELITEIASRYGAQSVVVSVDVKKNFWGKNEVYKKCGEKSSGMNPVEFAKKMEQLGAGEILLNHIDRDGTMLGYDIELVRQITAAVSIPVIACGGAGKYEHLAEPIRDANASAVAGGSIFVFHGKRKAVLINYPNTEEMKKIRGA